MATDEESQIVGTPAGTGRNAVGTQDFSYTDFGLYSLTVLVWGTSWIALSYQVGVVAPAVSLVWRFGAAATLMLILCLVAGDRLRFPPADHIRFFGLGVFIFSSNFLFFYYASSWVISGLLSVIFSLASVTNIIMSVLILKEPFSRRVAIGASLGVVGIGCLFWPEVDGQTFNVNALIGLGLGILGTICFSLGNIISVGNQKRGIPLRSATAIGMVYGTLFSALIAVLAGNPFIIEPTLRYLGSLAFLIVFASVIAFSAYLTLLGRIGADRAGYATVLFPAVALAVSTLVEGYQWTPLAVFGVALVLIGNWIVLGKKRQSVRTIPAQQTGGAK